MADVEKALKIAKKVLRDPVRVANPGIYDNPKDIVGRAAQRIAPESPALKQVFGLGRDELYERYGNRPGNMEPDLPYKEKARGSEAVERIMTPKNAQRIVDVLGEAGKVPALHRGMDAWYAMDPVYDHMEKLVGPEEAKRYYDRLNHAIGIMSAGSEVKTEINRGLAANYLMENDRLGDFAKYAGVAKDNRGPDFPPDLEPMTAHPYTSTSHAEPLEKYAATGRLQTDAPKVPSYIQASGVPATGFQTRAPVADAHFTRAVGLPDTRGSDDRATYNASMKTPEVQTITPWFRDKIAKKLGLEAVPAQARLWGAMSGETGVKTKIGAPKIEILAQEIAKIAKRLNIPLDVARDRVLLGKAYATGGAVPASKAEMRTDAQIAAGNYKKHHTDFQGIPITIENQKGTTRRGKGWQVQVPYHYGYIKRTQGADGDHVDVCLGDSPHSNAVFIVDQIDPSTGKFDEHKVMLGYDSKEDALDHYRRGFSDGKGDARIGAVVRMTVPELKGWLANGNTKKATRSQKAIDKALALARGN